MAGGRRPPRRRRRLRHRAEHDARGTGGGRRRRRQGGVLREAGRWEARADRARRRGCASCRRRHRGRLQLPVGTVGAARQASDRLRPTRRDHELPRPVLLDVRRRPDGSALVAVQHRRGRARRLLGHPVARRRPRDDADRPDHVGDGHDGDVHRGAPAADGRRHPLRPGHRRPIPRDRSRTRTTRPRSSRSTTVLAAPSRRRARSSAPSRRWPSTCTAPKARCAGTSRR